MPSETTSGVDTVASIEVGDGAECVTPGIEKKKMLKKKNAEKFEKVFFRS